MNERKRQWQQKQREAFRAQHGYSEASHYGAGGLRKDVLERDGYKCVRCGMTDEEHKAKWARPITVDHIDRDRSHNVMGNLQTLCLICHGRKDLLPRLRERKVDRLKGDIMQRRMDGETYQSIADACGLSVASVWKWVKRWEMEVVCQQN